MHGMSFLQALMFVLVWAALYIVDILVAEEAGRLYDAGASDVLVYGGGYELNTGLGRNIELAPQFSRRFFLFLGGFVAALLAWWFVATHWLRQPATFDFTIGALLLSLAVVDIRHVRNIFLFTHAGTPNGVSGQTVYPTWLGYRASAVDFLLFAAFFLILGLLLTSWVMVGGTFGCALLAARHWWSSMQQLKVA
jgi:hypothetical protein